MHVAEACATALLRHGRSPRAAAPTARALLSSRSARSRTTERRAEHGRDPWRVIRRELRADVAILDVFCVVNFARTTGRSSARSARRDLRRVLLRGLCADHGRDRRRVLRRELRADQVRNPRRVIRRELRVYQGPSRSSTRYAFERSSSSVFELASDWSSSHLVST
jgi:hypothetical protein